MSDPQSSDVIEVVTRAVRALKDGAARLPKAVQIGAATSLLMDMAAPMADIPKEMLALMSPCDRRRPTLIALPGRVRAFLKCVDDGWDGERLEASAATILQAVQEL